MNNELKKKLIDFDTKVNDLWDSMESIQFDNPELLDELGSVNQELIKSFNRIKNAIAFYIPKEVYGISKIENIETSVVTIEPTSKTANSNEPYWTHQYIIGKWYLASSLIEDDYV